MKILITGATGLIGQEFAIAALKDQHDVFAFARSPNKISFLHPSKIFGENLNDPETLKLISSCDAFVHLSGEPVAQTWNAESKKRIHDSRIESTKRWVELFTKLPSSERPKVFLCASAIGIYGDRGNETCDESTPAGTGFLADLTRAWEVEAKKAETLGIRTVILRTGIVLSRNGGALAQMKPVILGAGKQWMSWIHIQDEVRFLLFAIQNSNAQGIYNLTAPNPERNSDFTEQLANATGYPLPILASAPMWTLKLALGEMATILTDSQRVIPNRALADGFQFQFSNLESAMTDLYGESGDVFSAAQFIAKPLPEVFEFFSQAKNLERITPEFVGFKIIHESTPQIQEGTRIDYQIKLHGIPLKWRTLISEWAPPARFVDEQLEGPYQKWNHKHDFFAVPGGTLMTDVVHYKLPLGLPGKLVASPFVRADIEKIFSYRKAAILEIFKLPSTA